MHFCWFLHQLVTCYLEVRGQIKLSQREPELDLANVTVYSFGLRWPGYIDTLHGHEHVMYFKSLTFA